MSTILKLGGISVVIYSNDHHPVHVHVIGVHGETVFVLNRPVGPPESRESFGFAESDVNRIKIGLTCRAGKTLRQMERISWRLLKPISSAPDIACRRPADTGTRSLRVTIAGVSA